MFGEKLIAFLGLDATEFHENLDHAKENVKTFGEAVSELGMVLTAAAVIEWFKKVIEKGSEIGEMAERFHMTTDSLQALSYTATQTGVSTDALNQTFNKLSVSSADLSDKNSGASKAVQKLGIDSQAFMDLPLDEKLEAIAQAYERSGESAEAYSAVCALLGDKNAPRLNTMLKELADEGLAGVTDKAKEAGQVMSEQTIADMKRLEDETKTVIGALEVGGSKVLGFFFEAGKAIGAAAADLVNGAQGIQTVWDGAELAVQKTKEAHEQLGSVLKSTVATQDDIRKLEEARAKLKEKELSDAEKIDMWLTQYAAKVNEANKYKKDSKEYDDLMTQAIELQVKMADVRAKQEKTRADDAKKAQDAEQAIAEKQLAADMQRMTYAERVTALKKQEVDAALRVTFSEQGSADWIKASNDLLNIRTKLRAEEAQHAKNNEELAKLLLIPEGQRTDVQKEQIRLLSDQTTAYQQQLEKADLIAKLVSGTLTPAERERLNVLLGQVDAINQQNNSLKAQAALTTKVTRIGKAYQDQTTEELQYDLKNLQDSLFKLKLEDGGNIYKSFDGTGHPTDGMPLALQSEIDAVNQELAKRTNFATLYRLGVAKSQYSPDEYKRLLDLVNPPDTAQKIANSLDEINQRLSPIFPKQ